MVDTTVQPKAVAFPTDARLLHRARAWLVKLAHKHGVALRWLCPRILGSPATCVLCAGIFRPPTSHEGAVAVIESHPCPNAFRR
jgi:hypothetical protein